MIVPKHYENPEILHEGTMPARAYYIPASKRMDNLIEQRRIRPDTIPKRQLEIPVFREYL